MNTLNDKVFIPARAGVNIIHDKSARQFIPERSFDFNTILGLDKPKNRVKALTAPTSPKNCRIGKQYKSAEQAFFEFEVGLLLGPEELEKYLNRIQNYLVKKTNP